MKLKKEFYLKNAMELAPLLLGKFLCRKIDGKIIKAKITETECYFGFEDTASHAHRGKTKRNNIMFGEGGFTYIYLCYGIHNMLNIVTGAKNHPEAVLIRGIENYNGPGKVTKYLRIDRSLNETDLTNSDELWLEDNSEKISFTAQKRIGIGYASIEDQNKLWNFKISKKLK